MKKYIKVKKERIDLKSEMKLLLLEKERTLISIVKVMTSLTEDKAAAALICMGFFTDNYKDFKDIPKSFWEEINVRNIGKYEFFNSASKIFKREGLELSYYYDRMNVIRSDKYAKNLLEYMEFNISAEEVNRLGLMKAIVESDARFGISMLYFYFTHHLPKEYLEVFLEHYNNPKT